MSVQGSAESSAHGSAQGLVMSAEVSATGLVMTARLDLTGRPNKLTRQIESLHR